MTIKHIPVPVMKLDFKSLDQLIKEANEEIARGDICEVCGKYH